jgi:hypothetical protein
LNRQAALPARKWIGALAGALICLAEARALSLVFAFNPFGDVEMDYRVAAPIAALLVLSGFLLLPAIVKLVSGIFKRRDRPAEAKPVYLLDRYCGSKACAAGLLRRQPMERCFAPPGSLGPSLRVALLAPILPKLLIFRSEESNCHCAQGGFRPYHKVVRSQHVLFQTDSAILLQSVEVC